MKENFQNLNDWLIANKQIDISKEISEYLTEIERLTITKTDAIKYIAFLFIVKVEEMYLAPVKSKGRGGKSSGNKLSGARGLLVKYVLEKKIPGFDKYNVYEKLYGFSLHRTSVYHWTDEDNLSLEYEKIYSNLCKYLDNKQIIW